MKISEAAFRYLKDQQKMHSKIKDIEYIKFETQQYMNSPLFTNDEVSLLYRIRSRALDCKMNFKSRYRNEHLLCILCSEQSDTQQHILICKALQTDLVRDEIVDNKISYADIFASPQKQKVVTTVFAKLLVIREKMMKQCQLNPSTPQGVLKSSDNLHLSSVYYSSGNYK